MKPRLLRAGDFSYPSSLERDGIGGHVVLRFVVMEDGSPYVPSIQVLERSDHRFEASAKRLAATSWFAPGELNGRKVRVWVKQTVRFVNPNNP